MGVLSPPPLFSLLTYPEKLFTYYLFIHFTHPGIWHLQANVDRHLRFVPQMSKQRSRFYITNSRSFSFVQSFCAMNARMCHIKLWNHTIVIFWDDSKNCSHWIWASSVNHPYIARPIPCQVSYLLHLSDFLSEWSERR